MHNMKLEQQHFSNHASVETSVTLTGVINTYLHLLKSLLQYSSEQEEETELCISVIGTSTPPSY